MDKEHTGQRETHGRLSTLLLWHHAGHVHTDTSEKGARDARSTMLGRSTHATLVTLPQGETQALLTDGVPPNLGGFLHTLGPDGAGSSADTLRP